MKFLKSLPKDKLQKLILIVIVSLTAVGAVVNFYVLKNLEDMGLKKAEITKLKDQIASAEALAKEEANNTVLRERIVEFLKVQEERMVAGDPYSWIVREISLLAEKHPVTIGSLSPGIKSPYTPKPKYELYTTRLDITGKYDDLGRFVTVLENLFPTGQLRNLSMNVADAARGDCRINVDLVLLIHPKPPTAAGEPEKKKSA
ncbi:MAG: hypothetical protein PCFJNLEI_00013 [Verrucomicrobiae bacterium]|nr:hypothetical protein [Verrucomicrobiae bacterium]